MHSRRMERLPGAVDVTEDMTEQYMVDVVAMEGQLGHPKPLEDPKYMIHGHVVPMTRDELANSLHSSRPK